MLTAIRSPAAVISIPRLAVRWGHVPHSCPHPANGARRTLSDLNDFVDALGISAGRCDLDALARLLGAALGADTVVLRRGDTIARTIRSSGPRLSQHRLLALAGNPVKLPHRSSVNATATLEIGVVAVGSSLIFIRVGPDFSRDETEFASAVAREAGMALGLQKTLRGAAELQDELRAVTRRVERLDRDHDRDQSLLDRLARIEELISLRPPIDLLLESVVSGASYLIAADAVDIHLQDVARNLAASSSDREIRSDPGPTSCRAMSENRLVVDHERSTIGGPGRSANGACVMSAPVRVAGRVVGCLTAYKSLPRTMFSAAEQESLIALSMHASIALQDSRAMEAMRMSLDRERHRSEHDHLTGLPNRLTVLERLDRELEAVETDPVTRRSPWSPKGSGLRSATRIWSGGWRPTSSWWSAKA